MTVRVSLLKVTMIPPIDKILNPLDVRCAAWDLWKECLTQPDFDNTANTLIPMGTKEDPFWQGSGLPCLRKRRT